MIEQFVIPQKGQNKLPFYKSLPSIFILVLALLASVRATATARTNQIDLPLRVYEVTQHDLNADGVLDVTEIECAFATEHDRVLVYDQNGDMRAGNQWEKTTDFMDDVWVFDLGADGSAQLIVDFEIVGELNTALVYDDIDGDGQVRYRVVGNQISIEESSFWHVKAESRRSWMQAGGLLDTNMTFLVDGYAGLGQGVGSNVMGLSGSRTDGVVDWQLDIGDKDGDGIIDYQLLWTVNPSIANDFRVASHKATIFARVTDRPLMPYDNTVFWPLLIGKHYYEDYRYFDHPPVIAVDWQTGTIDRIGILGFPIEAGYHIFDRLPLEKNTLSAANYENPMAYYDMADDQDGWPELQVRFDVAVPNDPYFPYSSNVGKADTPNLEVNYSWDQDNDNRWDYKMNLSGNYPVDDVVNFPDFAIKSIPYNEIVPWVKNRTWDVATLVFDGRPSRDSEGMFGKGWMLNRGYANGKQVGPSGLRSQYLMGFSDQPPVENYQDIQEGMRGEYSFQYFDTPKVYLSSLDHQLHLYSAQSGVWNLGEGHYLRYANLDGDAYLDQWQEQRDGSVIQQLDYSQGIYVYAGNERVLLRETEGNPALFEAQPPGSYEEWHRFDGQLRAKQAAFAPEDFSAMFNQLSGPQVQIHGAALRDYRITRQGFRLVLTLQPGFTFAGSDWLGLSARPPGEYLVDFSHSFTIKSLTPAQIKVEVQPLAVSEPRIYEQIPIQVDLTNVGLEDKDNATVIVEAHNGQETTQVISQTVNLLSQTPVRLAANWPPNKDGEWQLVSRVEDQNGLGLDETRASILVKKGDIGSPATIAWLSSYGFLLPILALLLISAFFTAVVFYSAWTKHNL
jgi:hypothetical protein